MGLRIGARLFGVLAVALSISLAGCIFMRDRDYRLTDPTNRWIVLISDSPDVRRLIAAEDAREDEVRRFWREKHSREEGIQRERRDAAPGAIPDRATGVPRTHGSDARGEGPHAVLLRGYRAVQIEVRDLSD